MVTAIVQERRHNYLGNMIVFFTSLGRTLEVLGNQAMGRGFFVAPIGTQIVGLQIVDSLVHGIHTAQVTKGQPGAVASIQAWVGTSVDKVVFNLRNGKQRSYGSDGGTAVGPWVLEEEEYITSVDQNI